MQFNEVMFAEILNSQGLAYRLIQHFGSVAGVLAAPSEAFTSFEGISERQIRIIGALSTMYAQQRATKQGLPVVRTPEHAVRLLAPHYRGRKGSRFSVLLLDQYKQCVGIHVLSKDIHPAHKDWITIVLRHAVRANAKHMVIATNNQESTITHKEQFACQRLYKTAALLNIELTDYIKFGRVGWHSLAQGHHGSARALG